MKIGVFYFSLDIEAPQSVTSILLQISNTWMYALGSSTRTGLSPASTFSVEVAIPQNRDPEIDHVEGMQPISADEKMSALRFRTRHYTLQLDGANHFSLRLFPGILELRPLLEIALNAVIVLITIQHGGLALHSSACLAHKQALSFFGRSGAGKSTIVNLLKPRLQVLHDDFLLISRVDDSYYAHTSPFYRTDDGMSEIARLRRMFSLRHSLDVSVTPLKYTDFLAGIMESAYHVTYSDAIQRMLFENVAELCKKIPGLLLEFPNDGASVNDRLDIIWGEKWA